MQAGDKACVGKLPGKAHSESHSQVGAAERFRQLLGEKPKAAAALAQGDVAEPDLAQFFARSEARQALWSQLRQQGGQGDEAGYAEMLNASSGTKADAAERDYTRREDSSPVPAAGFMQASQASNLPQATAPSAAAPTQAAPADSQAFGELTALLSRHCEGVYVGAGAPGSAGRVMLRLSGALSGVSVEIASEAAGLLVRMHVPDAARWQSVASHTEELERVLAQSSGVPVRIEPVVGGGRS
jgi:hypothetical protein